VTITSASWISSRGASTGGVVSDDVGSTVTDIGVVWAVTTNPTVSHRLTKTTDGSGTGTFSSTISSQPAATTYYYRAYATTSLGTNYGSEASFTTLAQAIPNISYPSLTNTLSTGSAITPIQLNNTGGLPDAVQVITLAGIGIKGFVDGTGTAARFNCSSSGVAVDGSGNMYVADLYNERIRKITPAGVVSTLAGSGTQGFLDQSTPGNALSARFYRPFDVAVDGSGNVYVADQSNHRIRKIVISTGVQLPGAGCVNTRLKPNSASGTS
jgi:hypothetical protein